MLPRNVIWFNTMVLSNSRFYDTLKYGLLEVQEHLETFCDKRDQAMMVRGHTRKQKSRQIGVFSSTAMRLRLR